MFLYIVTHVSAGRAGFLMEQKWNENLFCTKRNNENIAEPSASGIFQEVVKQE
jgi:hypothetical protein